METITSHVRSAEQWEVPEHTYSWMEVVTKRQILAAIQPDARLYERHYLICKNRVVELQVKNPLFLLVENFSRHPRKMKKERQGGKSCPTQHAS